MVRDFTDLMRMEMETSRRNGWSGWDSREEFPDAELEDRIIGLLARVKDEPRKWISVANYAAILWWRAVNIGDDDAD